MPHLVLFQPVQMGIFSPAQEEQDPRGEVPRPSETGQGVGGDRSLAAICLGEKTAFRMRGHAEMLYQFLRIHFFFLKRVIGGCRDRISCSVFFMPQARTVPGRFFHCATVLRCVFGLFPVRLCPQFFRLDDQFGAVFEMHEVEMLPLSAPDETVVLKE